MDLRLLPHKKGEHGTIPMPETLTVVYIQHIAIIVQKMQANYRIAEVGKSQFPEA
jgi:hypothetical protein